MRNERLTMTKLIYSAITSLDGYVADEDGNFDSAAPDEEVHSFVNGPVALFLVCRTNAPTECVSPHHVRD
jgi:hypothetical protein